MTELEPGEWGYCPECDGVFPDEDLVIVKVDDWHIRYGCPLCGDVDTKTFLNDAYYELGYYLLSVADDDWAWPGAYWPLPMYEA